MQNEVEFTIKCKMKTRWVPHFIQMLKTMQSYGSMGCSRRVAIYSDGDGDFRPKFEFDNFVVPEDALFPFQEIMGKKVEPVIDRDGDVMFDAG